MGGVIFRPQQAMFFRRGRNEQDAAPGRRPRLQRAGKLDHACYAARIVDRAIADPVRRPGGQADAIAVPMGRSEEHTSELQSLMRISYAVFCLKKNNTTRTNHS